MGCTWAQEEAPPVPPGFDLAIGDPAPPPALDELAPSTVGIAGVYKIKLNGSDSTGNDVVALEVSDDVVLYKDLTIPLDSCERELRDEGIAGTRTIFMRIVAYVPDTQWRNGEPLLEKIEMCARCEFDPVSGNFVNTSDIINIIFQRDNEPPIDAIATRNGYSDKAKRLSLRATSFKGGGIFNAAFTETECLVCFEEFDGDKHMPMAAPCGHTWCSSCIVAVLAFSPPENCGTCPTCRSFVKLEDVKRVRLNH